MTELLYETNSHLTEFEAKVISCVEGKKGYEVVLDKTAFFPRGGGQEPDFGILIEKSAGITADSYSNVKEVVIKDGIVSHICDRQFEPGAKVAGKIDFERRFDFMQQHSGEHIVSGIVHKLFGADNVGFNLGEEVTTLDFNRVFTDEEIAEVELRANKAVWQNLAFSITYPTKEELDALEYRSKKELKGTVRIVEIPGIDICACCAPHVVLTGEIGQIKILSHMNFRGGTRVTILCGFRALEYFNLLQSNNNEISVLLSAKPTETGEAVKGLYNSRDQLKREYADRNNAYLDLIFEKEMKVEAPVHTVFIDEAETNSVRRLVNKMTEEQKCCSAVFTGNDENGYSFILSSAFDDSRTYGLLMKDKLNAKFGGKSEMIQGFVKAGQKAIDECIKAAFN